MADRVRTLGQVIGVERHLRQADIDAGKVLKKNIQSEALTQGLTKRYIPDDPDAPSTAREPDQYKAIAVRAEDALREAARYAIPVMDTVATKDRTNQHANADIIIGGSVLVPGVPMSHLLWLEHYLVEWKGYLTALPVLNPTRNWTLDEGTGLYKSEPEEQVRFAKEVASLVLIPPTDKHPGQAQPYNRETRTGKYITTILSGAVRESRKKELIAKTDLLLGAVKDAIARANHTPVTEVSEGETILGFLLRSERE